MTRVLISSHAYIVALNQQKVQALAQNKDLEVSLLVPDKWTAVLRETLLEKVADTKYKIFPTQIYFNGNNDRFFYHPLQILKVFQQTKPQIVHIEEEPWSLCCLQLMLKAKLFSAKTVFFTWENIVRKQRPWYWLIEKINLRLADGAIAGNQEAKVILETKGFKKPIKVIPQIGINLETFEKKNPEEVKKELGLKGFVIGFFARLDEQKGIKDLVESVKKLDFDWQLFIVGNGPLKSWVEDQARQEARIIYHGVAGHSEMPRLMNALDLFVLPSRTTLVWKEQFGHTIIEAMATEVPVIGSDSGAIPEVMGDAGLVFREGDVEGLAKQIKKVHSDKKLRQKLSDKGLERVKKHYTNSQVANQVMNLYEEIFHG